MHIHQLYQNVTAQIIAELERGAVPWVQEWRGTDIMPTNAVSKTRYNGINIPILWHQSMKHGYPTNTWLTYKQANAVGAQVRKGEKATFIVYTSTFKKEEDEEGYRFLKTFSVFNASQIDNLDSETPQPLPAMERHAVADKMITATTADIRHGDRNPMYVPSQDIVFMPQPEAFTTKEGYYATLFHELAHWSGDKKRLDRDLTGRFATQSYAAEELVAELASAFLCASCNMGGEVRHAGYIETWLKLLREDPRAIFTASAKAQQATNFIHRST